MWISRQNGSSMDGCPVCSRRARNSLGRLGKILGKNRKWPGMLCGTCGNRKKCPRFHIGGESSGENGSNFPQMPRLPPLKTCSAGSSYCAFVRHQSLSLHIKSRSAGVKISHSILLQLLHCESCSAKVVVKSRHKQQRLMTAWPTDCQTSTHGTSHRR